MVEGQWTLCRSFFIGIFQTLVQCVEEDIDIVSSLFGLGVDVVCQPADVLAQVKTEKLFQGIVKGGCYEVRRIEDKYWLVSGDELLGPIGKLIGLALTCLTDKGE